MLGHNVKQFRHAEDQILERNLFEAAQALLKEKTVKRSTKRASSPSLLTGRIFRAASDANQTASDR